VCGIAKAAFRGPAALARGSPLDIGWPDFGWRSGLIILIDYKDRVLP
jgi:hypothetical protein